LKKSLNNNFIPYINRSQELINNHKIIECLARVWLKKMIIQSANGKESQLIAKRRVFLMERTTKWCIGISEWRWHEK